MRPEKIHQFLFAGLLLGLLLLNSSAFSQTTRYWVGGVSADFNLASSWSTLGVGGIPDGAPVAGDLLIIDGSDISDAAGMQTGNVVITGINSFNAGGISLQNSANVSLQASAAATLTIGNATGTDLSVANGSVLSVSNNVNLSLAAGATATIDGILTVESGRNYTTNGTSITTVTGTLNNAGTVTSTLTGLVFNSGTYNHLQNGGVIPIANWTSSTCIISGAVGNTMPSGITQTFQNLTWNWTNQSGQVDINNSLTVNGTFRIQSTNGRVLNLCGNNTSRTVTTTHFQMDDGIFSLSNQNGNNGLLSISGNFVQNGGLITKSGNNASNEIRLTGAVSVSPVISGLVNSTGTNPLILNCNKTAPAQMILPGVSLDPTVQLTVSSGTLALGPGTSTLSVNGPFNFTGGTVDLTGSPGNILELKGTVTYTGGSLVTGCTNSPLVIYSGAAQNVMPLQYCNLTLAGSGTKTMLGAITVDGNLSIGGSASLYSNTFQINGNAAGTMTMGAGTSLLLGNTGNNTNVLFPSGFISSNISLDPASTVSYQNNSVQTVSAVPTYGNLTGTTGGTKTVAGAGALNVTGNLLVLAGTFDLGTAINSATIGGKDSVNGTFNFGTTVKSVSVAGNLSGTGTINMTGAALPHSLYLAGSTNAISTFNTTAGSGSTVYYNGAGNQTVFGSTQYRNLIISGGGTKSLQANSTINNDLTVVSGSFSMGTVPTTLTVTGNTSISGSLLFSTARANTVNLTGDLVCIGTIDMSGGSFTHALNLGGASNSVVNLITAPVASTITYNRAGDQTVFGSNCYRNLSLATSGIKTLQADALIGGSLTVAPATVTFNLGASATSLSVTGNTQLTGGIVFGNSTDKTVTLAGNLTIANTGTLDMSGNQNHILKLRGATNAYNAGGIFNAGTDNQTVLYDGDVNQSVMQVTYRNLTISNFNGSSVTSRTKSLSGTATVNGNLLVSGYPSTRTTFAVGNNVLTVGGNTLIDGYGTTTLGNANFTANGTTSINDNGILSDAGGATNLFTGHVNLATLAQWNVPQACTFQGGLTANTNSFVATGSTYTFNTNDQVIDGTAAFTLNNVVTATGTKTLTNANTGGLTIAGTLSGAGNFTNGNSTNNALLIFTINNNPLTLTGTPDFYSNPNTVNYSSASAQTISGVAPNLNLNFYNLTISGARGTNNVTLCPNGIIGISGVFNPSATFTSGNFIVTNNTIHFNGSSAQDVPVLRPANPTPYNNITISGNSTKSLLGNITINNILNLNGGVVELNNFNLTLASNLVNAIQGSFTSGNMLATDGIGYVVKNAASLQQLLPIGSGGNYSPVTITSIAPTTGTLSYKAVPVALNPGYIKKYWDIQTSIARTSVSATFQYDPAEANSAAQSVSYSSDNGSTWQNPPVNGNISFGTNSFSIAGTFPFSGWWTMGYKSYYSYQTGDWNNPVTWTSDPSGTLQIGNTVPAYNDNVVILSGRTVSLSSNIATSNLDITINNGAILDQGAFSFSSGLLALRGQGTLKLASAGFPVAVTNTFVNVGGGTTEYNAPVSIPSGIPNYNNLTINTVDTVFQLSDLNLNGNLYIAKGNYQLNDNTTRRLKLTIGGNFTVDAGASFHVGKGVTNTTTTPSGIAGGTAPFLNYYDQQSHRVVLMGDLTNNGTIRFTNLSKPIFNTFPPLVAGTTTGFATVYFMGATDNSLVANGTTDFYNMVLDKGTDQTYKLTVISSDYTNFRLFGANTSAGETPGANPNLKKALWIRTGTLELKGMVAIPSLTEGTDAVTNPGSDFYIPSNAALVLSGPDVMVLVTADSYAEVNAAYNVSTDVGLVNGVSQGGASSLVVLGKLLVTDGYLSTRESGGILYTNLSSASIQINDGVVDTKQLRSVGAGLVTYIQNGGTLQVRGRFQRTPSQYTNVTDIINAPLNSVRANTGVLNNAAGSFSLSNTSNIFNVSGGNIQVFDATGTNGKAFDVLSSQSNINVTGGTVELLPLSGTGAADADTLFLASNAEYGNLVVNRSSGSSVVKATIGYPITTKDNVSLLSGVLHANNQDLTIGGDFLIQNGTTYIDGSNKTIFNGTGTQTLTVNLSAPLTLNKLNISKSTSEIFSISGTQKTINVSDSLWLINASMNDNGANIHLFGNSYWSGKQTGTGRIYLDKNTDQVVDGDGNGTFRKLVINMPVNGSSRAIINNAITLSDSLIFTGAASGYKLLYLQSNSLNLGATAVIKGADQNRYVLTNGNLGDGGITKQYSPTSLSFLFPLGTMHGTESYTPANISFSSAPAVIGKITVVPVTQEHPNTTVKNLSLKYYWKVRSSGFSGITANSLTHSYHYSQDDVVSTEANYVPAMYTQGTASWTYGDTASVNQFTNTIGAPWLSGTTLLDGDYTCGNSNPTNPFGTPTVFYSRRTGLWSNINTWSLAGHNTDSVPSVPPGASDIVVIGGKDSVYLTTALTNPNTGVVSCASLQIESGSVLDIGYNPGCVFSVVRSHPNGNGIFRLTTTYNSGSIYVFPAGDFSEFNVNAGTTDYYTTNPIAGTIYILPPNVTSYGNLVLSPLGGSNLIFPNNNYTTVYGDLTCNGSITDAWLAMTWNGAYGAIVPKTVYIKKNFHIKGGAFVFIYNNAIPQRFIVDGDVVVDPKAAIDVWGASTVNSIAIGGKLINNSDGNTYGSTTSQVRLRNGGNVCDLSFFGTNPGAITSTSGNPVTILNKVTIDKGNSQASTVTFDVAGTLSTLTNNWLTLLNGTLRYTRVNPATDFTITTTGTFGIPSTSGLYINYSNTNNRNVLIANNAVNNNDLYLDGKLTLANGNVYVGPTNFPANNNDIEYAGSGASEIVVQGGNLYINGQIRRSGTSGGILGYTQTGGSVTINGNAANTTNAKLEVLNPGSKFIMTAGSLTIQRGNGGNVFGDLYLRPETYTVTGGDVNLVLPNSITANQVFQIEASVPLNNLTITGKTTATAYNATAKLMVSPLVLLHTLKLTNSRSFFDANSSSNISVTIGGDLDNSGTYSGYNNTTTFNGGIQNITGTSSTSFYNLVVNPVTSLSLAGNILVNKNLTIGSGTLACGNYLVTVKGDVANSGSVTDNSTGLLLNGITRQYISGNGTYGKVELNNTAGIKANDDLFLQGDLVMTNGILDINQHLLSLGLNSSISGSGFGITKMITTDGVVSSQGVRKFFNPIAVADTFMYPVGIPGKYSPATFNIASNGSVGAILVNPVNNRHPAVTDPNSVLKYYWKIGSFGVSGFNSSLELKYNTADVQGDESQYIAARLMSPGNEWSKATPGSATDNVDELNHKEYFYFAGTSNLNGDYTAGYDPALPDEVPTYESAKDGVWTDSTVWTPIGASPACPSGGPNGFNVIISHVVTTNVNYCSAYNTTINGKLKIAAGTFGHNLGTVNGSGTLYLEGGNLPAGDFSTFLDCSNNATLEYGGTSNYTIVASQFSSLSNVRFSGTGIRTLPNKDLTICHRFIIDGPVVDAATNAPKLILKGTMERYNGGVFNSGTGATATVSFAGDTLQALGGSTGDFNGSSRLNNLEINNPFGLKIGTNGIVEVNGSLLLTNGLINTTGTNRLIITNTALSCVIPAAGSRSSFVNGPLTKTIISGGSFTYPVGRDTSWGQPFTLLPSGGGVQNWTTEYFSPNTSSNTFLSPLQAVNPSQYWGISTVSSKTVKVRIGWNAYSDLTPLMTINGVADMRVAESSTIAGPWNELASTQSGTISLGDVTTSNALALSTTTKYYTSASVTTLNARAAFNSLTTVCGNAGIPVKFTCNTPIPLNYTLIYTVNGNPDTAYVTSLPYTLPTPVPGDYQLTKFFFNSGLNQGVVDPTIIHAYALPGNANAGPDTSLCGLSGVTLKAANPTPYTGLWSVVSGSGGTIVSPTQYNSAFTGVMGTNYYLRWTVSNGTCTSSDYVYIDFPLTPLKPSAFISAPTPVCQGSTGKVYSVLNVPPTVYNWTYSGTGATINGSGSSVNLDFNTVATGGTLSVTATNACGTSLPRSTTIAVSLLPSAAGIITGTSTVCQGQSNVSYSIPAIANATGYAWTLPTGAVIASGLNTNSISVNFGTSAVSGNIAVSGTNSCGSGIASTAYPVTVNPLPANGGTITGSASVCKGISGINYSVLAIANATSYTWSYTGSGVTINPGSNLITIDFASNATSGNLTVTGVNACGSGVTSSPFAISLNNPPTPVLTAADSSICAGTAAVFNVSAGSGPAITNYVFFVNGGSVQSGASSGYSTSSLSDGDFVKVLATTAAGCVASTDSVQMTIYPVPSVTISSSDADNSFCAGTNVTFTATAGFNNYSFRINGTVVQSGSPATYSSSTILDGQQVDVIATNLYGCSSPSNSIINTVLNLPVVTLSGSDADDKFCSGTSISYTATAGYANYTFRLDGITVQAGASNVFTSSALTNNQQIDVLAADASSCSASSPAIVLTVYALPVASTANNSPVCVGDSLKLSSTPSGMTYSWSGPSGFSSTLQNPLVSSSALAGMAGVYSLLLTDGNGCQDSKTTTVTVNSLPAVTIGSNTPVCEGATLNLTSGPAAMASYNWTGPGGFTSTLQNPVISNASMTSAGAYTAVISNGNCQASGTVNVSVLASPDTGTMYRTPNQ